MKINLNNIKNILELEKLIHSEEFQEVSRENTEFYLTKELLCLT